MVLKGSAPDVLHKSEHGLVALGLATRRTQIGAAFDDLSEKLKRASRSPRAEIVLQPQARPGVEIVVGVRNYPGFGSLLVVGLGGMFVELLKDTSQRVWGRSMSAPHSRNARRDLRRACVLARVSAGSKGVSDIEAAAAAIVAVSRNSARPRSARRGAAEINPLIVHAVGQGRDRGRPADRAGFDLPRHLEAGSAARMKG